MPNVFDKYDVAMYRYADYPPFNSYDVHNWLKEHGYYDAPASTKYHGAYKGGLYEHSCHVTDVLLDLTDKLDLEWERKESPVIVGLLHDLCKMDQYDERNGEFTHKPCIIVGHGDKSIALAGQIVRLTDEEMACVRYHMGAFTDQKEWNAYTNAIHKYPNVLWTHQADMIATHILEIKGNKNE